MGWNPTRDRKPERVQLETMDAGIYVREWLTGEQLAYQDRTLSEGSEMDVDEDGIRFRRFIPSALARIQIDLTVVDVDGDLVQDGVKFDPSNPEHLDFLDRDTFDEILGICQRVNPANRAVKRPEDHKPPAGDAEDPSRAQPTAPEASEGSTD